MDRRATGAEQRRFSTVSFGFSPPSNAVSRDCMPAESDIQSLIGIGPASARWLRAAGIRTRRDLQAAGTVAAYRAAIAAGAPANLNLLWAIEGARTDMHWTLIPPRVRGRLRAAVEAANTGSGVDDGD